MPRVPVIVRLCQSSEQVRRLLGAYKCTHHSTVQTCPNVNFHGLHIVLVRGSDGSKRFVWLRCSGRREPKKRTWCQPVLVSHKARHDPHSSFSQQFERQLALFTSPQRVYELLDVAVVLSSSERASCIPAGASSRVGSLCFAWNRLCDCHLQGLER